MEIKKLADIPDLNQEKIVSNFQTLAQIISQRKAIREYNSQKIPNDLIKEVTKIACRAPSWYGLEPWFVLVIESQKIKQDLYSLINQQRQVLDCSHLFLILSYKGKNFNWKTTFFAEQIKEKILWKRDLKEDHFAEFKAKAQNGSFAMFSADNEKIIDSWAKQQCFILLQNFLLLFTSLNIATSPMGDFQEKKIINYLENNDIIPTDYYNLPIIFASGYPLEKKLWRKKIKDKDWNKIIKIL